jgi:hypothetical protein
MAKLNKKRRKMFVKPFILIETFDFKKDEEPAA